MRLGVKLSSLSYEWDCHHLCRDSIKAELLQHKLLYSMIRESKSIILRWWRLLFAKHCSEVFSTQHVINAWYLHHRSQFFLHAFLHSRKSKENVFTHNGTFKQIGLNVRISNVRASYGIKFSSLSLYKWNPYSVDIECPSVIARIQWSTWIDSIHNAF